MRSVIKIHTIPLWPFIRNVFLISFVVFTLLTLIFGFFWVGMLRQLTMAVGDPGMPFNPGMLDNIGGMAIVFMSLLNGFFGSVVFSLILGIAGLIYNLVNDDRGGIELEVTLPDPADESPEQMETRMETTAEDHQEHERGGERET